MKRILFPLLLLSTPLIAQDIYRMESFTANDLNGTARFVGMGGAMGALGADISVMGTNPAGIGLYRKSEISTTASLTAQPHAEKFNDIDRTRASFDQLGFVYALNVGDTFDGLRFMNVGVNYQKSRNFKNHINIQNFATGGLSQSWQMMDLAYSGGWLDLYYDEDRELTTPFTNLGYDTQLIAPTFDNEGYVNGYEPSDADSYTYRRVQWGGNHEWDFNVAANINDRLYVGITAKYFFMNQKTYTDYSEMLINPSDNSLHEYFYLNDEQTEGEGYSGSLGVIFRPIESSPFRVGFSIHMPTYYEIETSSDLYMETPYASGSYDYSAQSDRVYNSYEMRTPWRFNVSMGGSVSNFFAYGAEYEYYDASGMRVTYDHGLYKDHALKREADRCLQGVHTLRLGAELRLIDGLYARAGYNYQSSPFKSGAYLNQFLDSSNYYYSTNTDYINLGDLQRVTAGVGYRSGSWYADMSYQYQTQTADVYAFHLPESNSNTANRLQAAQVNLDRHNVQFTVGYKF